MKKLWENNAKQNTYFSTGVRQSQSQSPTEECNVSFSSFCLYLSFLSPVFIVWLQSRYSRVSLLSFNSKINLSIHWINTTWGLDLGIMGREVIKLTKALPSLKQIIRKYMEYIMIELKRKKNKAEKWDMEYYRRVWKGPILWPGKTSKWFLPQESEGGDFLTYARAS